MNLEEFTAARIARVPSPITAWFAKHPQVLREILDRPRECTWITCYRYLKEQHGFPFTKEGLRYFMAKQEESPAASGQS